MHWLHICYLCSLLGHRSWYGSVVVIRYSGVLDILPVCCLFNLTRVLVYSLFTHCLMKKEINKKWKYKVQVQRRWSYAQYKICETECNQDFLVLPIPRSINACFLTFVVLSPEGSRCRNAETVFLEVLLKAATDPRPDLQDELLNRNLPLLKDNELICPRVGLHWELAALYCVS